MSHANDKGNPHGASGLQFANPPERRVGFTDLLGALVKVVFSFFDRKFKFSHDYNWECEMDLIPRIGDEVSLPDLDGGGPMWHKKTKWNASHAVVEDVMWYLEERDREEAEVAVYCGIVWVND